MIPNKKRKPSANNDICNIKDLLGSSFQKI